MTNAEKYLKDEVSIEELIFDIINFEKCWNRKDFDKEVKRIKKFFFTSSKPTLTEDERVILRNMPAKEWNYIFRDYMGDIQFEHLKSNGTPSSIGRADWYNHLFQFIKERRRI